MCCVFTADPASTIADENVFYYEESCETVHFLSVDLLSSRITEMNPLTIYPGACFVYTNTIRVFHGYLRLHFFFLILTTRNIFKTKWSTTETPIFKARATGCATLSDEHAIRWIKFMADLTPYCWL